MSPTRAFSVLALVAVVASACAPSQETTEEKPSAGPAAGTDTDLEPQTPEERLAKIRRVTGGSCTPGRNASSYLAGVGLYCIPFDAIPAIDDPKMLDLDDVDFLPDAEPVAIVEVAGRHRAYPVRFLSTHEIVNDVVKGQAIVVSFCPLCNSAAGFLREVGGQTLTFGVSGQLLSSNLVMFDRETISLWQQVSGKAFSGDHQGQTLERIPVQLVSFGSWRQAHPEGQVMAPPVSDFDYGRDPYAGYALNPNLESKFFKPPPESGINIRTDPRLPPKWRVAGVESKGSAIAFAEPTSSKKRIAIASGRVGQQPLVALFKRDTAKTSTKRRFEDADRGWAATVWIARAEGRDLRFEVVQGGFFEVTTGSRFNFFGEATSGPLDGTRLRAVDQITAFWFSWVDTYPKTKMVQGS